MINPIKFSDDDRVVEFVFITRKGEFTGGATFVAGCLIAFGGVFGALQLLDGWWKFLLAALLFVVGITVMFMLAGQSTTNEQLALDDSGLKSRAYGKIPYANIITVSCEIKSKQTYASGIPQGSHQRRLLKIDTQTRRYYYNIVTDDNSGFLKLGKLIKEKASLPH